MIAFNESKAILLPEDNNSWKMWDGSTRYYVSACENAEHEHWQMINWTRVPPSSQSNISWKDSSIPLSGAILLIALVSRKKHSAQLRSHVTKLQVSWTQLWVALWTWMWLKSADSVPWCHITGWSSTAVIPWSGPWPSSPAGGGGRGRQTTARAVPASGEHRPSPQTLLDLKCEIYWLTRLLTTRCGLREYERGELRGHVRRRGSLEEELEVNICWNKSFLV